MSFAATDFQHIFSIIKALLGVTLVIASPILIALYRTDRLMERKYPNGYPLPEEKKQRVELLPLVPAIELQPEVVIEKPLPPYEDPDIRKLECHELDSFRELLRGRVDVSLVSLHQHEGKTVRVAGMVVEVQAYKTKKKEFMANAAITDPSGGAEITIYPITWAATPIDKGDIVLIKGKIKDGEILVNSIEIVGEVPFGSAE